MNSQSQLFLDGDRRPYEPRHAVVEAAKPKPSAPAWAQESHHFPQLVGEGRTRPISYRSEWPPPGAALLPLPARAQGAALEAEKTMLPAMSRLGRCLRALPWGRK